MNFANELKSRSKESDSKRHSFLIAKHHEDFCEGRFDAAAEIDNNLIIFKGHVSVIHFSKSTFTFENKFFFQMHWRFDTFGLLPSYPMENSLYWKQLPASTIITAVTQKSDGTVLIFSGKLKINKKINER